MEEDGAEKGVGQTGVGVGARKLAVSSTHQTLHVPCFGEPSQQRRRGGPGEEAKV